MSPIERRNPTSTETVDANTFARAIINILEDANDEKARLELTHKAMLNILVDAADDSERLGDVQRAVLNVLDDFASEKTLLEETQKAVLNILDDFEASAQQLRETNKELVRLDELKSRFVAMASHELRTPLTSITGFSATMLDQWETLPDADKLKFVEIIDGQSQRLARLVDDLLTISTIEQGALRTVPVMIAVRAAVTHIVQELDAGEVAIECADSLEAYADPDHFEQILVNYLANAIRHGGVAIKVRAIAEPDFVRIQVSDEGPGVPEGFVPMLFERFEQADPDHSRSTDRAAGRGTGLGLSIVYALVEAHGGEAWYEQNVPTGACFNVRLPRSAPITDAWPRHRQPHRRVRGQSA